MKINQQAFEEGFVEKIAGFGDWLQNAWGKIKSPTTPTSQSSPTPGPTGPTRPLPDLSTSQFGRGSQALTSTPTEPMPTQPYPAQPYRDPVSAPRAPRAYTTEPYPTLRNMPSNWKPGTATPVNLDIRTPVSGTGGSTGISIVEPGAEGGNLFNRLQSLPNRGARTLPRIPPAVEITSQYPGWGTPSSYSNPIEQFFSEKGIPFRPGGQAGGLTREMAARVYPSRVWSPVQAPQISPGVRSLGRGVGWLGLASEALRGIMDFSRNESYPQEGQDIDFDPSSGGFIQFRPRERVPGSTPIG